MMLLLALKLQGFGTEAPRELLIAVVGLGLGWGIAHVKIERPARRRHEETMAAHRKVHDHLGIGDAP